MKYLVKHAKDHIRRTVEASNFSEEAMFRVFMLAIGSMRIHSKRYWKDLAVPTYKMLAATDDWNAVNSAFPGFISLANKRRALEYADKHRRSLYAKMQSLNANDWHDYLVKNVPGLGVVKAGFIVQMTKGKLGCVDSVNMKRLGIEGKMTQSPVVYRRMLDEIGETSERMWHTWCQTVADREDWDPIWLSRAHVDFVEHGDFNIMHFQ